MSDLPKKGRLMPDGVKYINSWVTKDMDMCYQVMESITEEKVREWISNWDDLSDFDCAFRQMIPLQFNRIHTNSQNSPRYFVKVFFGSF